MRRYNFEDPYGNRTVKQDVCGEGSKLWFGATVIAYFYSQVSWQGVVCKQSGTLVGPVDFSRLGCPGSEWPFGTERLLSAQQQGCCSTTLFPTYVRVRLIHESAGCSLDFPFNSKTQMPARSILSIGYTLEAECVCLEKSVDRNQ